MDNTIQWGILWVLMYSAAHQLISSQTNVIRNVGLAGPYHFDYKNDPLTEHTFDQPNTIYRLK